MICFWMIGRCAEAKTGASYQFVMQIDPLKFAASIILLVNLYSFANFVDRTLGWCAQFFEEAQMVFSFYLPHS